MGLSKADLLGGRFWATKHLDEGDGVLLVVDRIEEGVQVGDETLPVIYFRDEVKGVPLKPAVAKSLFETFPDSESSDQWIGQAVEVYHEPNVFKGSERVGGIRIRKQRF